MDTTLQSLPLFVLLMFVAQNSYKEVYIEVVEWVKCRIRDLLFWTYAMFILEIKTFKKEI